MVQSMVCFATFTAPAGEPGGGPGARHVENIVCFAPFQASVGWATWVRARGGDPVAGGEEAGGRGCASGGPGGALGARNVENIICFVTFCASDVWAARVPLVEAKPEWCKTCYVLPHLQPQRVGQEEGPEREMWKT